MIELSNFKKVNIGCKVATCDVQLPNIGMIIRGMALIESKGRQWASFPQGCEKQSDQNKYYSHCEFIDPEKNKLFLQLVLDKMRNRFADNSNDTPPSQDQVPF